MKRRALRRRYGRAQTSEREARRLALQVGITQLGDNNEALRDLARDNDEALRKILRSYKWFLKHAGTKA
jgi:hypothetical protein